MQSPHDPELARRLHKQAYSRSAVNISSVANGAFGEHRARPPAWASIEDHDDLLSIDERLALGFGALGFGRCPRCGSLAFLRSAVWTHE